LAAIRPIAPNFCRSVTTIQSATGRRTALYVLLAE